MDIEEAKKQLLKHKKEIDEKYISARYSKAIEVVLSELEKKGKIINEMAEEMVNGVYLFKSKNQVIDHFTNKLEEDK